MLIDAKRSAVALAANDLRPMRASGNFPNVASESPSVALAAPKIPGVCGAALPDLTTPKIGAAILSLIPDRHTKPGMLLPCMRPLSASSSIVVSQT
jgi:hypothetical protein